jgi:NADPH:quinone reductase-like Zn-dependent oxidoreductase
MTQRVNGKTLATKHLVLTQFGEPVDAVALREDATPEPGSGEVVVRMEAAVINPSDFLLIRGAYFARPHLPAAVGSEGVGVVVDAGDNADRDLIGKRVILLPTYTHGTWAQRVVAAQDDVVPVGDGDPLQLAMVPINPVTAHVLLNRFVDLKPGDWVGQPGANSAVGRYLAGLARLRGIKTLNVVRRAESVDDVRGAGADVVLVSGPNLAADIRRELGDDHLSLVVDPIGGSAAAELVGALKPAGTVVSIGAMAGDPTEVSAADLMVREIRHTGFWLGSWFQTTRPTEIADTIGYLAGLVTDGQLRVPVEASYNLDDYRRALRHAEAPHRSGKILFTFD